MLENDLSPTAANNTIYLKDYKAPDFLIDSVKLNAQLGKTETLIIATLLIRRNGSHSRALILDGEKMQLVGLKLNGKSIDDGDYVVDDHSLTIKKAPNDFVLEVQTKLQPHLNTELSGLYQSSGNFCTQCEAQGFRRITYFLDRPDVLATYQVTITADKKDCPVLLSNGNFVETGDNGDGTHWAKWNDPHPKPSYLFALVAGDLEHITDKFVTQSGNSIELNIYTQSHNIDKCEHAMTSLINSMKWDEQVYGREYDLEVYNIVAVDDFNMGAMENKGLNVFNSKYVLANQQTATDSDFEGIESVIAHEYFHNWSGNRVTCRDWFQLSLKEGFTVFRDQEFSADMGSRGVKRIRDVQTLRAYQFKEDAGPMAHPVRPDSYQEINNFYTVTIYEKGAEVIRMMHALLGADGFRKGTDLYFDTFDGQAVTTEDFVSSMEKANEVDLSQFRLWYTQSGTPELSVSKSFSNDTVTLKFKQTCPDTPGQTDKKPFQIPVTLALFDLHGSKLLEKTVEVTQAEQEFEFSGFTSSPMVSLLRDFSAPVKLHFNQSNQELAALAACDDNGFARWESLQRLTLNLLLPAIEKSELDNEVYQTVLSTFRSLLEEYLSNSKKGVEQDSALLSEMMRLPAPDYITQLCNNVDPQAVVSMRETLQKQLANDLEPLLLALYQESQTDGTFSLNSKAMAQRSLKNTALNYLVACEKEAYYELANEQYRTANNMTESLAAFSAIAHSSWGGKQAVIDDFYQQWKSDTLVLDKWFAIQAMSPEETLSLVNGLMTVPEFAMNNPNKVRSLVGAFAGNMKAFHNKDGSGYQFIADRVIELNGINPQVAARMVGVFNNWKAFAEPYSTQMQSQLTRISQTPDLTKDVKEIVSKALI